MNHNITPVISVIMSVYNSEHYLIEAVNSVLKQTFKDFEFIITDDGSMDNSFNILEECAKKDNRIVLLKNPENLGLTKSLNKMLEISKGKYIARMDADDISLHERFEKQYEYMEKNPSVGVLGTNISYFENSTHVTSLPLGHNDIITSLLFEDVIMHPSVMLRSSVLSNNRINYDDHFIVSQDYDLWVRLINNTEMNNLNDILLKYRFNDQNISNSTKREFRNSLLKKIFTKQLNSLGIEPTDEELMMHIAFSKGQSLDSLEKFCFLKKWIMKIILSNTENKIYNESTLKYFISRYWFILCTSSTKLGIGIFKLYFTLKLKSKYSPSKMMLLKFFIKSLVKHETR